MVRMGFISQPDFEYGQNYKGAKDAGCMWDLGGVLHQCFGTDNSGSSASGGDSAGCFNDHWLSNNSALNWQEKPSNPVSPRNEAGYAQTQGDALGFKGPSGFLFGGKNGTSDLLTDSYRLSKEGIWTKITDEMQGWYGVGVFFQFDFDQQERAFYVLSGQGGDGKIRRSYDLKTWQIVGDMPDQMADVQMGFAFKIFRGVWFLAGVKDVGCFYKSYNKGQTWEKIGEFPEMFGYWWPNFFACDRFISYQKGTIGPDDAAEQGGINPNRPGSYYLEDPIGIEFTRHKVEFVPGHATAGCSTADGNGVWRGNSNMHTHVYLERKLFL